MLIWLLSAQTHDELILGQRDRGIGPQILGGDLQVSSPGRPGRRHDTLGRHIPDSPHAREVGVLAEHGVGHLLGIAGEIGTGDSLGLDDLHAGIVLGDCLCEALIALFGDEEVGLVIDDTDLPRAAEGLSEQVGRNHTVAVVVGRDDRLIVLARHESVGDVVHEDELHSGFRCPLVGRSRGHGVGRDGDDDVGFFRQHGLDVRHLLTRAEVGIGDSNHVDAQPRKLCFQPIHLGSRPVIARVVHHDGCRSPLGLDLSDLGIGKHHRISC